MSSMIIGKSYLGLSMRLSRCGSPVQLGTGLSLSYLNTAS